MKDIDLDPDQWTNAWNIIKNARPHILTHEAQCKNIVSEFKFDIFLDLGPGRAGTEAWSISRLRPDCLIYGFEPQYERYQLLEKHKYPGTLQNTVIASTVGTTNGFMGFEGGKSDFWLKAEDRYVKEGAYKRCIIECTTIDSFIEYHNLNNVFIWADIEGAELDMLKGATQSFEMGKIVGLNLELSNTSDIAFHCTSEEVVEFLKEYNFIMCSGDKAGTHGDYLFKKKNDYYFTSASRGYTKD